GVVAVSASGDITVDASLGATGIDAYTFGGDGSVYSGGDLDICSSSGNAAGVRLTTYGTGDLYANLVGDTTVYGYLDAVGVLVHAGGSGDATAVNAGAMTVSDAYATAQGMVVLADGGGNAGAVNDGAIDVYSAHGLGTGISA